MGNSLSVSDTDNPYGLKSGIQIPTAATCKLSLFRNEIQLSTASCFLTEDSTSRYLVTALHNFSGRDFFTRKCLSEKLATPNRFRATVMIREQGDVLRRFELRGDLFSNGMPLFMYDWSEQGGDIAILRMPKEADQPHLVTMNDITSRVWTAFAGLDVFALGYPSAIDVTGTPIWKKVSIASEPSQKVNGKNMILTDGLTFSGMSGGPVIICQSQGFTDDKEYALETEMTVRLLGVYGGRFHADKERSGTLGFFWPIETVDAIIADKRQVGDIECE